MRGHPLDAAVVRLLRGIGPLDARAGETAALLSRPAGHGQSLALRRNRGAAAVQALWPDLLRSDESGAN